MLLYDFCCSQKSQQEKTEIPVVHSKLLYRDGSTVKKEAMPGIGSRPDARSKHKRTSQSARPKRKPVADWTQGEKFGPYKPRRQVQDDIADEPVEEEDTFDLAAAAPAAYDALVTLLRPDAAVQRIRKRKRPTEGSIAATEEVADQSADDSEESDLENVNDFEADEDPSTDPFQRHFQRLSPTDLEEAMDHSKDRRSSVLVMADHKIISQAPSVSHTQFKAKSLRRADLCLRSKLAVSASQAIDDIIHGDPLLAALAPSVFQYQDLCHAGCQYSQLSAARRAYALHILNHLYKSRDCVMRHTAKLAADPSSDKEYRDQGFTRPKVLVLLPTRNACLLVVDQLIELSGAEVENRKRFKEQYGLDGADPIKESNKPEDFKLLFGGHTDDAFKLGIKLTKKALKLYSTFYASDLILASPLGLKMVIDASGKGKDCDYLSSIEMVVIDSACALKMQNWEHVQYCLDHTNTIPVQSHGCDYSRVRNWLLEEKSKYVRQTIVLSSHDFPELRALYNSTANVAGKIRVKREYPGILSTIGTTIRQQFQRFDSTIVSDEPDVRFRAFKDTFLPRLKKHAQADAAGCVLFIPSYFDFVRVRNHLKAMELNFEAISEYTSTGDLTRARHAFASGRSSLLIITERFHHFRRYELKGINRLYFYQVPEFEHYYKELVRMVDPEGEVKVQFSRWDESSMERIVGYKRLAKMLAGRDSVFEFV